jgi:hypothetical protein
LFVFCFFSDGESHICQADSKGDPATSTFQLWDYSTV